MADSAVALAELPLGGIRGELDLVLDLGAVAGAMIGDIGGGIGGGRHCCSGVGIGRYVCYVKSYSSLEAL